MRYKDSLQLPFFWAINIILPITAAVYYYNFRLCKLQEKSTHGNTKSTRLITYSIDRQ